MVIFFNLCLILAVIFSKFLKPNVAKMLREREREKSGEGWGGGGGGCGSTKKKKEKKKEREMKIKKEDRENIFVK
jgi:hypothetical protein